jgi:hypothetical protein
MANFPKPYTLAVAAAAPFSRKRKWKVCFHSRRNVGWWFLFALLILGRLLYWASWDFVVHQMYFPPKCATCPTCEVETNMTMLSKILSWVFSDGAFPVFSTYSYLCMPPISSSWKTDKVTPIIHQIAPKDVTKWDKLWPVCQKSMRDHFPTFQHKIWSDVEDIDHFMKTFYPAYYGIFQSYQQQISRIDFARYFILYEYGGIYIDSDFYCVDNYEHLLVPGRASVAESPYLTDRFQNALMASPPKHPFWLYIIAEMVNYIASGKEMIVIESTGPRVINRVVKHRAPSNMINTLSRSNFAPLRGSFIVNMSADPIVYKNLTFIPPSKQMLRHLQRKKGGTSNTGSYDHTQKVYTYHLSTCAWCKG